MQKPKISYEYYANEYNTFRECVIPPEDFDFYLRRAWAELDCICTGECTDSNKETVINTVCAVADILYTADKTADVRSESIDGYSVTYAGRDDYSRSVRGVILKNLGNTGLLYAGVELC